jgi:hypothetical protein
MNKLTRTFGVLAVGSILIAGCGAGASTTSSPTTAATEATTTTTYVAPTTTTTIDPERIAMLAWAATHGDDMTPVSAALDKVRVLAHQISTTAGNNIDDYTSSNDTDQLLAGANKLIALQEQQKKACLAVATAAKAAQKGLPVPVAEINEPYSSALDHYLSASRACQVGDISEAAEELGAGNDATEAATRAIENYLD